MLLLKCPECNSGRVFETICDYNLKTDKLTVFNKIKYKCRSCGKVYDSMEEIEVIKRGD